ncbi:alanine racemase [Pectinatus brassicae]|uniref:Alanine racemase n=1 Tax=Pectinatus brassicae TaxID=862415 RepID=A0A840UG70_9FIRM|nr:alanine racemase [Pectinatus brassicae]MBB5335180.1 alanine racemase [Pectinatus brassicae]
MDMKALRPAWVEIDLDQLAQNMREIRRLTQKTAQLTAVIKANAYGHGACETAPLLLANGADRLAVAELDEAIELRLHKITAPILILGPVFPEQAKEAVLYGIDIPVFDYATAKAFSDEAVRQHRQIRFHIKIDSGMGRIGFQPNEQSLNEIERISKLPNIVMEGIFTHFATADCLDKSYTNEQFRRFKYMYDSLAQRNIHINTRHCANSASIIDLPDYHLDMARAGIILYGLAPSNEVDITKTALKPVMSFKCRITHIKQLHAGDSVSYGRKFIADKDCIIATLPVGYADGYTRMLSGKAHVLIHGQKVPVIGNICMDQCMVDISNIDNVHIGDEVILFGSQNNQSITADELADELGTINYEIVCMMARRLPRIYIKNNKPAFCKNYLY